MLAYSGEAKIDRVGPGGEIGAVIIKQQGNGTMKQVDTPTSRNRSPLFPTSFLLCLFAGAAWGAEPKWESLIPHVDPTTLAVAGEWTKTGRSLSVAAANGARLALPMSVKGEYDLRISFTRKTGQHSVGVIVVHGGRQAAVEVDAWGMHLAGIQNLDGRTIRENATRRANVQLKNGRRYTLTVEVRKDRLRALLDDQQIANHLTDGGDLSLPDLWAMPDRTRPGLIAWNSDTEFHAVEYRSLSGAAVSIDSDVANTVASATASPSGPARVNMRQGRPKPDLTTTRTPSSSAGTPIANTGEKHVLIVIANGDFFYREYADPRSELERAGIRVTVAAGRKEASRPHRNSGEGADGGIVMPDMSLRDVKARDFDAILFSGGWGASMYQYAFEGRYNTPSYNGDRATKSEVNRIINEFIAQDKYVCALCNAVSVLAWARVDGKSPLHGKHVCAPTRAAASGIYNGRQAQPSCRWHPEQNGAILSPPGAVGAPNTNRDDVIVDGKIITGEDDPSAREMGRRIADVLRG
ncbi:MAG: cyclic nucleotide-binding protein [Pirellulaceae bacterium]